MEPEELEEIVALYVAAEIDAVSVTDFPPPPLMDTLLKDLLVLNANADVTRTETRAISASVRIIKRLDLHITTSPFFTLVYS